MKKLYASILLVFLGLSTYAQIICPNTIKTSGQSTPSNPIFTVPNGQNGCNESWPLSIIVNSSLIYDYDSCSGGNLKYNLQTGQTAPTGYDITVDFGNGVICNYDTSGNLATLSDNTYEKLNISVTPNPTSGKLIIGLDQFDTIKSINLYSVSGKLIYNSLNNTEIDISEIRKGLYILQVSSKRGLFNTKIIKE